MDALLEAGVLVRQGGALALRSSAADTASVAAQARFPTPA